MEKVVCPNFGTLAECRDPLSKDVLRGCRMPRACAAHILAVMDRDGRAKTTMTKAEDTALLLASPDTYFNAAFAGTLPDVSDKG